VPPPQKLIRNGALLRTTLPEGAGRPLCARNDSISDGISCGLPCGDVARYELKRTVIAGLDQKALASDRLSRLDVARRIADEIRTSQIEAQVSAGRNQHRVAGFPARTSGVRRMRTAIPSCQRYAAGIQLRSHALHDRHETCLRKQSSTDAALVRCYDERQACLHQHAHRGERVGTPAKIAPA
jgi:hypothetical protein